MRAEVDKEQWSESSKQSYAYGLNTSRSLGARLTVNHSRFGDTRPMTLDTLAGTASGNAKSRLLRSLAIAACLVHGAVLASDNDTALRGCWRPQQTRYTYTNGTQGDQNGDCVVEYSGGLGHTRCHTASGNIDGLVRYEMLGPGRLRVTVLDVTTRKPKGVQMESNFRVDGDWLVLSTQFGNVSASGGNRAQSSDSVYVRVEPGREGADACRPRAQTGLRVGDTPISSLALATPSGWKAALVDPADDPELKASLQRGFLVGAFVPQSGTDDALPQIRDVIVLDDLRFGPAPIHASDFVKIKRQFLSDLGVALCDDAIRVCGSIRLKDGGAVYTELLNVRGRVAMISAVSSGSNAEAVTAQRQAVQAFDERLLNGNP